MEVKELDVKEVEEIEVEVKLVDEMEVKLGCDLLMVE